MTHPTEHWHDYDQYPPDDYAGTRGLNEVDFVYWDGSRYGCATWSIFAEGWQGPPPGERWKWWPVKDAERGDDDGRTTPGPN